MLPAHLLIGLQACMVSICHSLLHLLHMAWMAQQLVRCLLQQLPLQVRPTLQALGLWAQRQQAAAHVACRLLSWGLWVWV